MYDKINIPPLRIGNLEARLPIIQGGMGVGISLSGLASAVANEGGIGVIATAGIGMLEPDFSSNFKETNKRALKKELRKARKLTDGIIGVNIMMAISDLDDLAEIAVNEGADIIFLGAGLPLKNPDILPLEQLQKVNTKIVPIVSSARAAKIIFQYWAKNYDCVPDAVVVEGPLAGGHLGFKKEQINNSDYNLEKIIPEVIDSLIFFEEQFNKNIPVIAAGGVYTGADILKFIKLGANGVQMGTRFVATYECDASAEFKETYLKCKEEDIIIVKSPVGLPGRAIRNNFLDDVLANKKKPINCPWKCLKPCDYRNVPYCIAIALTNAQKGKMKNGLVFAGANAFRIERLFSVKELISTLLEEYNIASFNRGELVAEAEAVK